VDVLWSLHSLDVAVAHQGVVVAHHHLDVVRQVVVHQVVVVVDVAVDVEVKNLKQWEKTQVLVTV